MVIEFVAMAVAFKDNPAFEGVGRAGGVGCVPGAMAVWGTGIDGGEKGVG